MRTSNLAFLVLVVVTTACNGAATPVPPTPTSFPIPEGYYNAPCQQPEGTTLHEWLDNLEWYGEIDLSGGGWDCSQVVAYVEWLAENCGHDAVYTGRGGAPGVRGHVWLTIEGAPYEASGLYWINLETADQDFYRATMQFQDIYEVFAYTERNPELTGLGEWGWWITYPELMQ